MERKWASSYNPITFASPVTKVIELCSGSSQLLGGDGGGVIREENTLQPLVTGNHGSILVVEAQSIEKAKVFAANFDLHR